MKDGEYIAKDAVSNNFRLGRVGLDMYMRFRDTNDLVGLLTWE